MDQRVTTKPNSHQMSLYERGYASETIRSAVTYKPLYASVAEDGTTETEMFEPTT